MVIRRRGRSDRCVVEARGRRCLESLILRGVLRRLILSPGVCGISVLYSRMPLSSALRRIRADILSLEALGERRGLNAIEREEYELLQVVEGRIAREAAALRTRLLIHVCGALDEIVETLKVYSCSIAKRCGVEFFQRRVELGAAYPLPPGIVADATLSIAAYLVLVELSTSGVFLPIGVEQAMRVLLGLPVLGEEGARHTAVVGPTGRGKTTLLALLGFTALLLGLKTYIVDAKGDLVDMVANMVHGGGLHRGPKVLEDPGKHVAVARFTEAVLAEGGPALVLVDEAWRLPRSSLERLFRLGRGYSVSVVVSSQYPGDLGSVVWSNTSNVVVFGSRDSEYLEELRRHVGVDVAAEAGSLGTGEAALLLNGFPTVVVCRVLNPAMLMPAKR